MKKSRVYLAIVALLALGAGGAVSWASFPIRKAPAPQFTLTELTPLTAAPELGLGDTQGTPRSIHEFQGRAVILFFGFTRCAEGCPTELFKFAQAVKLLGADASRVQVLFVTLDPERDAPELLQRYVSAFDSRFVGLTGSRQEIDATAARYFIAHGRSGDGPDYVIDHS